MTKMQDVKSVGPRTMHACVSTYMAICGPFMCLLALYVYLAVVKRANVTSAITIIAATLACFTAWIRSFQIKLTADGIEYRYPFFRRASIPWSSVASVKSGTRWEGRRPLYFMALETNDGSAPLTINIKPFGKRDVVHLATALRQHSSRVELDETTERMLTIGKMPSLFRSTGQ